MVLTSRVADHTPHAADRSSKFGMGMHNGGMPEWLKGTDCKSVGFAYVGSNPTPSTMQCALRSKHGTDGGQAGTEQGRIGQNAVGIVRV